MISEELAQYIDSQGFGVFDPEGTEGNIFLEELPSKPIKAIALYNSGASPSDIKLLYDNITIQIIVRGENLKDAQNLAQRIYNHLQGFGENRFIDTGFWIVSCIALQSQPIFIGINENRHYKYSLNFDIEFLNDDRREY